MKHSRNGRVVNSILCCLLQASIPVLFLWNVVPAPLSILDENQIFPFTTRAAVVTLYSDCWTSFSDFPRRVTLYSLSLQIQSLQECI